MHVRRFADQIRSMRRCIVTTVATAALLGFVTAAAEAADPAVKCHSGKLKESAKYASCRLKAESKAILVGGAPNFSKCIAKFPAKFNSIETDAGPGICPSEGDGASIDARITSNADVIALLLSGTRYVDNGNWTVTDVETGLMWHKTDDAGGVADKDNTYTFAAAGGGTAPSGTMFTDFLDKLNGGLGPDTCFAGHCDWRIPTIDELQTILLEPVPCGTNPCIDQAVFGPQNASSYYWSFTTASGDARYALIFVSADGTSGVFEKYLPSTICARAVRGGS